MITYELKTKDEILGFDPKNIVPIEEEFRLIISDMFALHKYAKTISWSTRLFKIRYIGIEFKHKTWRGTRTRGQLSEADTEFSYIVESCAKAMFEYLCSYTNICTAIKSPAIKDVLEEKIGIAVSAVASKSKDPDVKKIGAKEITKQISSALFKELKSLKGGH